MTFDPNSPVDHLRGPMSDPTTPVEVLAHETDAILRTAMLIERAAKDHPKRLVEFSQLGFHDAIVEPLERLLVALQAQDHTDTKGGLDVKRLAEAFHRTFEHKDKHVRRHGQCAYCTPIAEATVKHYTLLEEAAQEPTP